MAKKKKSSESFSDLFSGDDSDDDVVIDVPAIDADAELLARFAAEAMVLPPPTALVPVYCAVDSDFLFGGETYSIPAGSVGGVPRPVAPSGSNRRGCRAMLGDDGTVVEAETNLPIPSFRRIARNLALIAEANADVAVKAAE